MRGTVELLELYPQLGDRAAVGCDRRWTSTICLQAVKAGLDPCACKVCTPLNPAKQNDNKIQLWPCRKHHITSHHTALLLLLCCQLQVAYDERMAALAKRAGAEGALAAVEALIEAERHRQGLHTMQVQGTGGAVRAPVASAAAAGEGVVAILQQVRREGRGLSVNLHGRLFTLLLALKATLSPLSPLCPLWPLCPVCPLCTLSTTQRNTQ